MIRIEKDKILYIDIESSGEPQEIYPAEIPAHLGDIVELGEFVTFSRIFDLIVEHKDLFNTIFAKDLGHQNIEQYLEEYSRPVSHTSDSFDLEVHVICQAHDYQDYRDLEYYVSFQGMGIMEDDTKAVAPYPISLSFTSLNELKNRYIRVNNSVQIFTYTEDGNIERSPEYDVEIKLFDFFAAILEEISFYGDPENRDEISEDIVETAEAVARGEEEMISWEEIQEQWDRELKDAEREEERVRLEEIQERVSADYITHFIESTYQEAIEKLEQLESDLVSLERYEDAKLVREKIEKLKSGN